VCLFVSKHQAAAGGLQAMLCCGELCLQDAMSQLDACKLASPDAGLFSTALKQHSSLDFFDFVPYTACQLHPQLQES